MKRHVVQERAEPLDQPTRPGLHHIGNSTHWIVLEGVRVLTDPWLCDPADHVLAHRCVPVPLPRDPDLVLLTHEHEDHFDPCALERLDRSATVLVPAGELHARVRALGFTDARGVQAGDHLEVRGVAIDVVRGKHNVPEVCFRLEKNGRAIFFGGDTMLTDEIEALAREKPVPFAILPGERSSLLGKRFVMTPEEAVAFAQRLGAKRAVLTHHEYKVVNRFPFGWMVSVPEVKRSEFPEWFVVPSPGDYVPFPWEAAP